MDMLNDIEIWKNIDGLDGYQVSSFGRVKNTLKPTKTSSEGYIKPFDNGRGYLMWHLRGKSYLIHRHVALAFIPNPLNKETVNHIDGKKTNNRVTNLEWATQTENSRHSFSTGLNKNVGSNHSHATINEGVVKEILALKHFLNMREISRKLNVRYQTVVDVLRGSSWNHITGIPKPKKLTNQNSAI